MMLIAFGLSGSVLAGEPCEPATATSAGISETTALAMTAFAQQDLSGLNDARQQSLDRIPCLSEMLSTDAAAALHRMLGLAAFTEGQTPLVLAEFQAARRLAPEVTLEGLVLEGHPLSELYTQSLTEDLGEGELVVAARGSVVVVDGVPNGLRSPGALAVVQRYEAGGALTETRVILPDERIDPDNHRALLLAGTGVSAVSSAVLYALSLQAHQRFWDTTDSALPDSELDAARARANALSIAATGAAGGTLLLGTITVVSW